MRIEYGTDTTDKVVFEDKDFPKKELLTWQEKISLPENYSGTSEDPHLVALFNELIESQELDALYVKEISLPANYKGLKTYLAFDQRFSFQWDTSRAYTYRTLFASKVALTDMQILYILGLDTVDGKNGRKVEIEKAGVSKKNHDKFWSILEYSEIYSEGRDHSNNLRAKAFEDYMHVSQELDKLPTPTQLFYYRASGIVHSGRNHEDMEAAWGMVLSRTPAELEKLILALNEHESKVKHYFPTMMSLIEDLNVKDAIEQIRSVPAEWLRELSAKKAEENGK